MLILANTLAMATRERTTEYAVMRAIGFQPRHIVGMVLGEGLRHRARRRRPGRGAGDAGAQVLRADFREADGRLPRALRSRAARGGAGGGGRAGAAAWQRRRCRRGARASSRSSTRSGGSNNGQAHEDRDARSSASPRRRRCWRWCVGLVGSMLVVTALGSTLLIRRDWVPVIYNVRSLGVRRWTTGVTALGLALVVFVFTTVLMLAAGVRETLQGHRSAPTTPRSSARARRTRCSRACCPSTCACCRRRPETAMGKDGKPLVVARAGGAHLRASRRTPSPTRRAPTSTCAASDRRRSSCIAPKALEGRMFTPGHLRDRHRQGAGGALPRHAPRRADALRAARLDRRRRDGPGRLGLRLRGVGRRRSVRWTRSRAGRRSRR